MANHMLHRLTTPLTLSSSVPAARVSQPLSSAKHGLQVLVVEKSNFFGGTTAYSGGRAWIPENKHQPSVGIKDDTREKADVYLKNILGGLYHPTLVGAFLTSGPRMVEWMEDNTPMKFKPGLPPDYAKKKPVASVARTLLTREFDASVLGRQRPRALRYTLQGFHAFGPTKADPAELAYLSHPFSSVGNFAKTTRKVLWYI